MKRLSVNGLRRQAGVTILEFIAFIGLAALVIAGALGLYSSANSGAQANDLFQAASGIATTVRQVAAGGTIPPVGSSISAPTGWTTTTNLSPMTYTKTGSASTKIVLTLSTNNYKIELTAADQKTAEQVTGKTIGTKAGTRANSVVTWTGIEY